MNNIHKLKGDKSPLIKGSNVEQLNMSTQSAVDTLWRKVADIDFKISQSDSTTTALKTDLSEKLITKKLIVNGLSVFYNDLYVVNGINISGDIYSQGNAYFLNGVSVDGSLAVGRHITGWEYIKSFGNTITDGNSYVSGNSFVSGNTNLYNSLGVSGNITASGNVDVKSILNVSGISNLFNVLNLNSSINISGNSSISGTTNNYGNVYNRSESYFGNVSGGDYTKFENDGTMVAEGDAMVYEDLNFDVLNSGGPAAYVPDYVEINNVIYREFASTNNQYCGAVKEIPHAAYMSGQTLTPHCHIFLKSGEASGTTGVTFKLNWDLRYNSTNVSGNIDIAATSAQLAASGNILRLYGASGFACSTTTGGQLAMKIARVSGDAGDVVVTTYGVHVACDMFGSRSINSK